MTRRGSSARPPSGRLAGRQARGRAAEDAAVRALEQRGYRIVERNARAGGVEIDIVARDGDVTVFVEVRSRTDRRHGGPLDTIGPAKQERLVRGALAYLTRVRASGGPARFDVVGVDWVRGAPLCRLVRGAFESQS